MLLDIKRKQVYFCLQLNNKQDVFCLKFCLPCQTSKRQRQTIFMALLQTNSITVKLCPAPPSLDLGCKTRLFGTTEQQERKKPTSEFWVDQHLQDSASAVHISSHVINTNVTKALLTLITLPVA